MFASVTTINTSIEMLIKTETQTFSNLTSPLVILIQHFYTTLFLNLTIKVRIKLKISSTLLIFVGEVIKEPVTAKMLSTQVL